MELNDARLDDTSDYEMFTPANKLVTAAECDRWNISYEKKSDRKYKARADYPKTSSWRIIVDSDFNTVKAWIKKKLREFEHNNRKKINISIEII